ncbi:hypothetical protein Tco_0514736 [Tanacetum coccineum]
MSDSDESGVTYTEVSSPFEGLSDIGSPRADDHEYLELSGMLEDPYVEAALQAPPSPDYVHGPEEPEQAPPSPDYVLGPDHADDGIVAEDQPYAEDASPTAQSPNYVLEYDPEADPEEDNDEDPEEDPVDYPADGGDDGDDEDGSSEDDKDDDMDIESDDDEEEEHPAPADFIVVALPSTDQAPSAEETEPSSVPSPVSMVRMQRLSDIYLAISIFTSSPFLPWSSPLHRYIPFIPPITTLTSESASTSHSLPLPSPFILSPTRSDAPSSGIPPPLPISVPTSSPPLLLPSTSHREDRPEVTLPPWKRLGIALGLRYEVGESLSDVAARSAGGLRAEYGFVATMDREIRRDPEREVGYGITDSWDEIVETLQGAPVSTDTELGRHMTTFETRVRQDTDEIYTRWRQWLVCPRSLDGDRMVRRVILNPQGGGLCQCAYVLGQMSECRELHAADAAAAYTDIDSDAVIIGIGDHTTGMGDSTIGTGYCTTWTAGTRWRSCTARAAKGGW